MKHLQKLLLLHIAILLILSSLTVSAENGKRSLQAPAPSRLYAKAAVLMDAASGRVLYEKNGQEILPMASTTKILTCILALEYGDMEETVDISAYAASMPKVKLYVKKGEQYRLGDLLYSLMLESHNDVAVAIAEHLGKEFLDTELQRKSAAEYTTEQSKKAVAAFADLMNEKAAELGCKNSWFITPNGLDATETFHLDDGTDLVKNHSTTATDLATIMSYCVLHSPKKEEFLQITQTLSHSISSLDGTRNFFCSNHNAFLTMMEGAISGKTGFTNQAGYCYVGALEQDGRTFVVALLACGWPGNKTYKWSDTKVLMNYGLENYTYHSFTEVEEQINIPEKVQVLNGQTDYIGQFAYVQLEITEAENMSHETLTGSGIVRKEAAPQDTPAAGGLSTGKSLEGLLLSPEEEITVNCQVLPVLEAPIQKGDIVGTITYEVAGQIYRTQDIVVTADIKEIDLEWCIRQVFQKYFVKGQ